MNKEKDIVILYESGLTIREISERVNLSYETIRQILKKQKVKWHRNYVSDFTPNQIQAIISKFDNGESVKDIAKWYEISASAVSRLLKANNRTPESVRYKYEILRQTPLNSIQKQILVGTLLGGGCLHKDSKKGNYKLFFSHKKAHEQYFHWKVAMFHPFINNHYENVDKRGNSIMLQAKTICHKELNQFAGMFYDKSRVKHVPKKLDMYLTPLSLAVWVQDNGNLNKKVNMRIATMSFTEDENYLLRDYLRSCFDIRSKVMGYRYKSKQYWQITINKENTQKLSDIIREHVVDCMKYKIMPESSTTNTPNIKIIDEDIV